MADVADDDHLQFMLAEGWTVAGFSTCLSTLGVLIHTILLQRGSDLKAVSINVSSGNEDGRYTLTLSPAPPKKRGWFG